MPWTLKARAITQWYKREYNRIDAEMNGLAKTDVKHARIVTRVIDGGGDFRHHRTEKNVLGLSRSDYRCGKRLKTRMRAM